MPKRKDIKKTCIANDKAGFYKNLYYKNKIFEQLIAQQSVGYSDVNKVIPVATFPQGDITNLDKH